MDKQKTYMPSESLTVTRVLHQIHNGFPRPITEALRFPVWLKSHFRCSQFSPRPVFSIFCPCGFIISITPSDPFWKGMLPSSSLTSSFILGLGSQKLRKPVVPLPSPVCFLKLSPGCHLSASAALLALKSSSFLTRCSALIVKHFNISLLCLGKCIPVFKMWPSASLWTHKQRIHSSPLSLTSHCCLLNGFSDSLPAPLFYTFSYTVHASCTVYCIPISFWGNFYY